jgi:hypothetical protein
MLFSPSPKRRRLQLRISERRLLLMAGDALAVVASVLIALRVWAFVARYPFTLDFCSRKAAGFVILVGLWLLLASARLLRSAQRRGDQRYGACSGLPSDAVVYLLVLSLCQGRCAAVILFWCRIPHSDGIWRLLNPALLGGERAAPRAD